MARGTRTTGARTSSAGKIRTAITDAQSAVLAAAGERLDGRVALSVRVRGRAAANVLEGLAAQGLIELITADGPTQFDTKAAEPDAGLCLVPWRLTRAGRRLVGIEEKIGPADASAPAPSRSPPRTSSKLGAIVTALGAREGITLASLCALTGWQAHTVRAALTRLRQRSVAIERVRTVGVDKALTAYRLRADGKR